MGKFACGPYFMHDFAILRTGRIYPRTPSATVRSGTCSYMTTRRNRIVELQEPVVVRDSYGSEVTTWTTRDTVWASFETPEQTHRASSSGRPGRLTVVRLGQFGITPPWTLILMNVGASSKRTDLARTWNTIGIKKGSQVGSDWTVQVKA